MPPLIIERAKRAHSLFMSIDYYTRQSGIWHEQYFHEPKASVNIRVKCPAILHDDKCNKLFILT